MLVALLLFYYGKIVTATNMTFIRQKFINIKTRKEEQVAVAIPLAVTLIVVNMT